MKFKDLKYKGKNSKFKNHCLKHLAPEVITLNNKKVLIQFSIHTWTKERFSARNTNDVNFIYPNGNIDKRKFDLDRYELSINLKSIIKGLTKNHKLLRDFKNNDWFVIKNLDTGKYYHIFMNIKENKYDFSDYYMVISSAYEMNVIQDGQPMSLKFIIK